MKRSQCIVNIHKIKKFRMSTDTPLVQCGSATNHQYFLSLMLWRYIQIFLICHRSFKKFETQQQQNKKLLKNAKEYNFKEEENLTNARISIYDDLFTLFSKKIAVSIRHLCLGNSTDYQEVEIQENEGAFRNG